MKSEPGEEIVSAAVDLVVSARWRSLIKLAAKASRIKSSKQARTNKLIIDCLSLPPFKDTNSNTDLEKLAKLSSRAAYSCGLYRAASAIMYASILRQDYVGANAQAQSAITALLDVIASAREAQSAWIAEELISRSQEMVYSLDSQASLKRAVDNAEVSKNMVFILGMHRSGTSALTGMLAKAGLSAPIDLMPADPVNPKGYWESLSIYNVNERFLHALGFCWSSSISLPIGWQVSREAREWRSELLDTIHKAFKGAHCPLIKDPRLCLLIKGLEPWMESDLLNPVFLIPVRNPLEVARSLEKAQNLSLAQGLKLWIKSVFEVESTTRNFTRQFIAFDALINNPAASLSKCKDLIGGGYFRSAHSDIDQSPDTLESDIDSSAFVDPSLQHQRLGLSEAAWAGCGDMLIDRVAMLALDIFAEISCSASDRCVPTDILDSLRLKSLSLIT